MERSRHGLLVVIFVGVVGIALTLGIILYSRVQTNLDFASDRQTTDVKSGGEDRVFTIKKAALRQLKLEINGRDQLHIFWDAKQGLWQLDDKTTLPVDQSKLNNYIDSILLYRFVGEVKDLHRPLQSYGLDYPTYVLTLQDDQGKEEKLWLGGRLPGSLATYAVSSLAENRLQIVPNPTATILAEVRDFFLDNVFSVNGEELSRLRLQIPKRSFDLNFEKTKETGEWSLIEPTSWPVFKGEFEAYLRNLIFFSAVRYYTDDELRNIQFESDNIVAHITLQSEQGEEEKLAVYSDRLGNFYGKMSQHPYYILLPASFQTVIYKPINLLLDAFPLLPAFEQLESFTWQGKQGLRSYRLIGEYWFGDFGMLSSEEEERLEVWYNGLRQNTILSTQAVDAPTEIQSHFILETYTKASEYSQVQWKMITDETAVVWQNGKNTHFIVRAPQPNDTN